jgi:hypothetical protein
MALPALRKRAEEEARDLMASMAFPEWERRTKTHPRPMPEGWATGDVAKRAKLTRAHLALLADLSRPASRWELAALISERLGWDAVETLYSIERGFPNLIALYRAAKVPTPPGYDPNPTPEEATAALALAVLGGAS